MGLDMYAYAVDAVAVGDAQVDFKLPDDAQKLHYWRKHHDLHGWMQELYVKKGGTSSDFNTDNLRLTEEDLVALESDLRTQSLPPTEGFFFGNFPPDDESLRDDLEFISAARAALEKGKVVVYTSWW